MLSQKCRGCHSFPLAVESVPPAPSHDGTNVATLCLLRACVCVCVGGCWCLWALMLLVLRTYSWPCVRDHSSGKHRGCQDSNPGWLYRRRVLSLPSHNPTLTHNLPRPFVEVAFSALKIQLRGICLICRLQQPAQILSNFVDNYYLVCIIFFSVVIFFGVCF